MGGRSTQFPEACFFSALTYLLNAGLTSIPLKAQEHGAEGWTGSLSSVPTPKTMDTFKGEKRLPQGKGSDRVRKPGERAELGRAEDSESLRGPGTLLG